MRRSILCSIFILPRTSRTLFLSQKSVQHCVRSLIYNEIHFVDNGMKMNYRSVSIRIYRYESCPLSFHRATEQYLALKSVSCSTADDYLSTFLRRNIIVCGMEWMWKEGTVNNNTPDGERERENGESERERVRSRDGHVDAWIILSGSPWITLWSIYRAESFARRRQRVFRAWKGDLANDVDRALRNY